MIMARATTANRGCSEGAIKALKAAKALRGRRPGASKNARSSLLRCAAPGPGGDSI